MAMAKDSTDLKKAMFQVSDGVIGAGILVFLGVVAGNWLDSKLNTAPWLSIVLSVIGGGLGLWRLVKKAMEIGEATNTPNTKQRVSPTPGATEMPEAEQLAKPSDHWADKD